MPTYIPWRRKAGSKTGVVLALLFASILTLIGTVDVWLGLDDPPPGATAPATVRLPAVGVPSADGRPIIPGERRVIVGAGETVETLEALELRALHRALPSPEHRTIGLFLGFVLLLLALLTCIRHCYRGRIMRVQLAVLGGIAVMALIAKLFLLFTTATPYWIPVACVPLLVVAHVDRLAGLAAAVAAALVVGIIAGFDLAVAAVLGLEGLVAVFVFPDAKRSRNFIGAGALAGVAGLLTYAAVRLPWSTRLPLTELFEPSHRGMLENVFASPGAASLASGVLAGALALLLRRPMLWALDELSRPALMEYADLDNPLLKQIARDAPGTWQHSLAMANMAEICANAIGANALLARVGAYYHDLGKSLQCKYFVENLRAGEPSPHDELDPEVSADAIFSHVTEGVRLGREKGLPEAIIDFMHMHHGDGVVEFFWGKTLEQGNPKNLPIDAFRYPGVKPQSRETGILAIVDAVEAAGRTLKQPDEKKITNLIQRIVYGKLTQGQLDQSGLGLQQLGVMSTTLVEILLHAYHDRIEYPWQKEAAAEEARRTGAAAAFAAPSSPQVVLPPPRPVDDLGDVASTMMATDEAAPAAATGDGNGGPPVAAPAEPKARSSDSRIVSPAVPPHSMVPPRRRPTAAVDAADRPSEPPVPSRSKPD